MAVHAAVPFVCVWDDHEYADDCWGDHATYFDGRRGDEADPDRRLASDRAWFEYIPADVVRDATAAWPDDMRIYRRLRFGQHIDLFLTDLRTYRSDHVVPEGPAEASVGKFSENSSLGSRNFALKSGFDVFEAAADPRPTMLGAEQKRWLIDGLTGSDAAWKLWGSSVQLAQMTLDLSGFPDLPEQYRGLFYFSLDQWDGYRSERAEVLAALAGVPDLVALVGDIHAFLASELQVDFDQPAEPMGVEFVCAGISSPSVQALTQRVVNGNEVLVAVGLADLVPRFDELLRLPSPHYKYSAVNDNGVAVMDVDAERIEVTYLIVEDATRADGGMVRQRVRMRVARGSSRIELVEGG